MNDSLLSVTPRELVLRRRQLLVAGVSALGGVAAGRVTACETPTATRLGEVAGSTVTDPAKATSYNNYIEFSPSKEAVKHLARELTTAPWPLRIHGLVDNPITLSFSALLREFRVNERIYRFRCVEGWSMVVPWQGMALCDLLSAARPLPEAKFVVFRSLHRPEEMIGQRRQQERWPYVEGLRLDEALHPLSLLASGMYQAPLPPQNGGPLRLVVPWKYGFKSIKAVVDIEVTAEQPVTTWQRIAPTEYGFYGNVNPDVPHPRWSQARENRLGELRKRPTEYLNGYADEVAQLYRGMDPSQLY